MTDLAKLVVRLEAETAKYQAELEKANSQLSKFAKDQDSLFGKLAGTFAAFFTIDKLKDWGEHVLETADHVGKLSERTGITTESLSKLIYAFGQSSVSGESFTTMLRKLNQNLSEAAGNAKSDAAVAFKAMGIDIKDATGRVITADVALAKIADRFTTYADGANKSALATALLGKTGEEAIPALNGGADALKRLGDEAESVGAVISGDLAKQAEEFNSRLTRLKTLLVDGIGNRIAAELLPNLNALGEEFEGTANKSLILQKASEGAAELIRGLTFIALEGSSEILQLGNAIGAVAAAVVAAVQGDFRRAGEILKAGEEDNNQIAEETQKAAAAIWRKGGDEVVKEVQITARKIKDEAPNIAGGKELEEAARRAIEKLKGVSDQIGMQAATFDMGQTAIVKYRLEIGDLADDVKAAGEAGQKFAQQIVAQARALEGLQVAKQLEDINQQIEELKGNTAEATLAEFDRKNAKLFTELRRAGNDAGIKQLETLTKLIVAQADFNELQQKASRVEGDLSRAEQDINNAREEGSISELKAEQMLSEARQKAADDLKGIADEQLKIAEQSGNPELIEQAKQAAAEIANLQHQARMFGDSIKKDVTDSLSDSLKDLVKNIHNAGDAFDSFIQSVADQLLALATKQLAEQIVGAFDSLGSDSSGGGGFFAKLAGAFAGGKAEGGDVMPGMAYKVNEKTANSEWFMPKVAGSIVPAHGLGGQSVQQNFMIQAPKGTVSRETQLQIGAQAARGLQQANRRNN